MIDVTEEEIRAFLEEQLSSERAAQVEELLRNSDELRERALELAEKTSRGVHSVGQIWRNTQLSCPSRSELGGFLLGTLPREQMGYLKFHLETVGCRLCCANLADLQLASEASNEVETRRQKYFQTSVGYLRNSE